MIPPPMANPIPEGEDNKVQRIDRIPSHVSPPANGIVVLHDQPAALPGSLRPLHRGGYSVLARTAHQRSTVTCGRPSPVAPTSSTAKWTSSCSTGPAPDGSTHPESSTPVSQSCPEGEERAERMSAEVSDAGRTGGPCRSHQPGLRVHARGSRRNLTAGPAITAHLLYTIRDLGPRLLDHLSALSQELKAAREERWEARRDLLHLRIRWHAEQDGHGPDASWSGDAEGRWRCDTCGKDMDPSIRRSERSATTKPDPLLVLSLNQRRRNEPGIV